MIEFDPHHRIDLTGPWAGFSFLGDRLIRGLAGNRYEHGQIFANRLMDW
ncbi:hypothetical protein [Stenotrophomonas sp. TD3]|nr:hypothetical protein [Stenotrophomonas sp. TD3]